jgi:predicted Zn-dependent peptidase
MEQVNETETVSIGFWFLHGSRDEPNQYKGYSHFIEHMLFKGTEKRTAFGIIQEIDRVGGILNAFTEKEQTCFYCTVAAQHIELAIKILADMIFNSVFPEEEIEREKHVIINEIQETEDNPEEQAYEYFLRTLWGDHPLADKITGEVDNIESITRDNLITFYNQWYTPSHLLVSIAGRFEPKRTVAFLAEHIPARTSRAVPQNQRTAPVDNPDSVYISGNFKQVQLFTGVSFQIPEHIEEFYHFLVFSTAVGESMSSRLFQRIRENKGLCYSVFSMRSFFTHRAVWSVYSNTVPAMLNQLVSALDGELKGLITDPLTEAEIEDAKSHLIGSITISKEDMETRMKRLVRHFVLGREIHDIPTSIEKTRIITRADINRFINSYIETNPFHFLAYGTRNLGKRKKKRVMVPAEGEKR